MIRFSVGLSEHCTTEITCLQLFPLKPLLTEKMPECVAPFQQICEKKMTVQTQGRGGPECPWGAREGIMCTKGLWPKWGVGAPIQETFLW